MWLSGFLFRSGLALGRVTHSGSKLPDDCKETIEDFFSSSKSAIDDLPSQALRDDQAIPRQLVYSADESYVRLDDPGMYLNM